MRVLLLVLTGTAMAIIATAMSRSPQPHPPRGIAAIEIEISEWSRTTVWATIVDRRGRRSGGSMDRPFREILGCSHQFEWEQGVPSDATGPSSAGSGRATDDGPPVGM